MDTFKMVVVDGIRYRPEDAPTPVEPVEVEPKKAAPKPANKARPNPRNKAVPEEALEDKAE